MSYKLLLADDSVTIQKVVELTFSDEDFEIISVADGNAALEKIKTEKPDIILSDVIMPGMNGYDLCSRVKQDPNLKNIPFLFLKGTFESFDEERANSAGADGFVVKPFESHELIPKVKEMIERASSAVPSAAGAPEEEVAMPFIDIGILEEVAPGTSDTAAAEELSVGQPISEPEAVSEEDLWSEVKITDHPIPTAPAEVAAPEPPSAEAEELEVIEPLEEEAVEEPAAAFETLTEAEEPSISFPGEAQVETAETAVGEPAAETTPSAVTAIPSIEDMRGMISRKVEEVLRNVAPDIIREVSREVISEIVWEVVPDVAERLIKREIDRLTGGSS